MDTLVAYLKLNQDETEHLQRAIQGGFLASFTVESCEIKLSPFGKVTITTGASQESTIVAMRMIREKIKEVTSRYPDVISYAFIEQGKAKLPVKRLAYYSQIFQVESMELIHEIASKHPQYLVPDIASTVKALSEYATTEFVAAAYLDNETRKLKLIVLDIERREKAISRIDQILETVSQESPAKYPLLLSIIKKTHSKLESSETAKQIALAILANAIFEYAFKPIVEAITRLFGPGKKADLDELANIVPELSYLMKNSPADLISISQAVGKEEWDTLVNLNWLTQAGIVIRRNEEARFRFTLKNTKHYRIRPYNQLPPTMEEVTLNMYSTLLPSELLQ